MQISLLPISLLQCLKKIHKFALCESMPYALGYLISLVRFANANFGSGDFFPEPKVALGKNPL